MKELTILVDQDGTLAQYNQELLRRFRERYPDRPFIPVEDAKIHDVEDLYQSEDRARLFQLREEPGFFMSLPKIEGCVEALEEMLRKEHDVRICTSPLKKYENCVAEKYRWIEMHFGRTWTQRMIITRDKTLVVGDILIDDKPEIKGLKTPTWRHILYDQPYNKGLDKPRLNWQNWKEVLKL